MTTRSLTKEFVRKRSMNATASSRNSEWRDSDSAPLVGNEMEMSNPNDETVALPPEWVDDVEDVRDGMGSIREKLDDLTKRHKKHADRPDLDMDASVEEEHGIEILTQDITSNFHRLQKKIQIIGRKGNATGSDQEKRVTKNVMGSLARELQDLSTTFRQSQAKYLKKMRNREERERGHFDTKLDIPVDTEEDDIDLLDAGFTDEQKMRLRDNTMDIAVREEEILHIVKSITELSEIFKDLAVLIVDQGTILDRIDYNIEHASYHVEEGHKQLIKGEKYQKKATKKILMILLGLIVVTMFFVVIFVKKNGGGGGGGGSDSTTTTTTAIPQSSAAS